MMDRLAAIADIVPPTPAVPPPVLPWWQGLGGAALLLLLVLLVCAGGLAWWRSRMQRRALRQLRTLGAVPGRGAATTSDLSAQVSAALVCARRGGVDLQHVPQACRRHIDALRYQASPDPAAWPEVIAALTLALRLHAWQRAWFWRALPGSLGAAVLPTSGAASASPLTPGRVCAGESHQDLAHASACSSPHAASQSQPQPQPQPQSPASRDRV
jgi:hypothetical protein